MILCPLEKTGFRTLPERLFKESEMVECDVKISSGDLYDYNLKYTYGKPINIIAEIAGIAAICYGIYSKNIPLAVIGAAVLVYLPITLWIRSKQTAALNPAFKKPLHYVLDDDGLTVSQDDQTQTVEWDKCLKAVSTSRSILLYTSGVSATIFPKDQLGDKTALVIRTIAAHMPPDRVNIKG